jgi:MarR family transcriptional regulator, organic hydroperoxide resistance regulator
MHKPLTVARPALLTDGSDRNFRSFLHAFMIFARRLEAVRDFLAEQLGVTAPQYEILSHLRECVAGAGLTVGAIAERLHCTGAFATTEVGKLARLGLVTKRRDSSDARRVLVNITDACESRFRQVAPLQRHLNDTLFNSVSAQQFKVLHEIFPALAHDGDRAIALTTASIATRAKMTFAG